jgi:hypothetical protein
VPIPTKPPVCNGMIAPRDKRFNAITQNKRPVKKDLGRSIIVLISAGFGRHPRRGRGTHRFDQNFKRLALVAADFA